MIAYHILCHGNFKQVARLVESLYSKDDIFLIDIDDGKNPKTRAIEKLAKLENVHVKRDANIAWGAGGTLRKTLEGAFECLDICKRWVYYVVLSGQDLPLKSNTYIKEQFEKRRTEKMSYIRSHPVLEIDSQSLPPDNRQKHCILWGDRGHTRVFAKPGAINPQAAFGARWLVQTCEVGEKGEVYVGNCDRLLLKRRQSFFKKFPFHVGANWFNLHRDLIKHMRSDPFALELYDVLRTTFIPDESYFQTYIMNSEFRDKTSPDYGRLILRPGPVPRVKVLSMEDWPTIETCSALYGRKFDMVKERTIVDRVLRARAP
ncbi:beta-1,6-N-acetylglucosaminyltransferase [bacterium]|nr:beta-1,6-N-acetylglucosaminyltransferase [bacterium]